MNGTISVRKSNCISINKKGYIRNNISIRFGFAILASGSRNKYVPFSFVYHDIGLVDLAQNKKV